MPVIKIKNDELTEELAGKTEEFPKYTTQIINLANQNAQGTRPRIVGQLSDLIQEFPGKRYEEWGAWYQQRHPQAINDATRRIYDMVLKLKTAAEDIDEDMVKRWVRDLILTKTFVGMCFQQAIIKKIATIKAQSFKWASPEEESRGIDGWIGDTAVSIKPVTYKTKNMLRENIEVAMIYYDKKKDGITVEFDF